MVRFVILLCTTLLDHKFNQIATVEKFVLEAALDVISQKFSN